MKQLLNPTKMDKIYNQAKDVNVRGTYVYVKTATPADTNAYADDEYTRVFSEQELKDIFLKGMVIVDEGIFYKPASLAIAEGAATVSYAKEVSTVVTIFTVNSLVSLVVDDDPPAGGDDDPPAGGGDDPPAGGEGGDPPAGGEGGDPPAGGGGE